MEKIDWDRPIRHLDGREAYLMANNLKGPVPFVVVCKSNINDVVIQVNEYGRCYKDSFETIENVPKPKKVITGYINFYSDGQIGTIAGSRVTADMIALEQGGRIGCKKVTFTEGVFDE